MKTTLILDDQVVEQLKKEARRRRTSMSDIVNRSLRLVLSAPEASADELDPLPTFAAGNFLLDISSREELYRVLDDDA